FIFYSRSFVSIRGQTLCSQTRSQAQKLNVSGPSTQKSLDTKCYSELEEARPASIFLNAGSGRCAAPAFFIWRLFKMSTPEQIAANRANSQHSTGAKTEAGKTASSQNNFRHC